MMNIRIMPDSFPTILTELDLSCKWIIERTHLDAISIMEITDRAINQTEICLLKLTTYNSFIFECHKTQQINDTLLNIKQGQIIETC